MTRSRIGLLLALALATGACNGGGDKPSGVASLGAAGSATSTTAAGGGDDRQKALNWARCMRQHGINLPDPTPDGGFPDRGRGISPRDRDDPKFKAAQQACGQYRAKI
jgi:hypothetical protein